MASDRYPDGFSWDKSTKRYRNKATGKFLPAKKVQRLRDEFVAANETIIGDLTTGLAENSQSLRSWEAEVWNRITITWTAEFLAGRGGRNAITDADRKVLGRLLKKQRTYLRDFANEIKKGEMSEIAISARAKLYIRSSRQAFETGKARAWDIVLPAYPADGSSECKANDQCHWEITKRSDKIDAYWRLSVGESCETCIDRGTRWNPYSIPID